MSSYPQWDSPHPTRGLLVGLIVCSTHCVSSTSPCHLPTSLLAIPSSVSFRSCVMHPSFPPSYPLTSLPFSILLAILHTTEASFLSAQVVPPCAALLLPLSRCHCLCPLHSPRRPPPCCHIPLNTSILDRHVDSAPAAHPPAPPLLPGCCGGAVLGAGCGGDRGEGGAITFSQLLEV